jgi:hypothetical protein
MGDRPESEKRDDRTKSIIALALSVLSILISFGTFYLSFLRSGELVIHRPTGFCIVRGYEDLGFKSDHLIIPFVIENTGKGTKVFEQPTLSLKEKNSGHKLIYRLTGFIPDLYRTTMDKAYQIGFGTHIPENSVERYFLVFHIENWWDSTKPEYSEFQFKAGQEWAISLDYFYNGKAETWHDGDDEIFFTMPVYATIDKLTPGGSYNSDCFSLK